MKNYYHFFAFYVILLVTLCITATQTNAQATCKLTAGFNFTGQYGQYINFHDLSTDSTAGAAITSWVWNFGDSATSTDQNPSHYYFIDSLPSGDTIFNVCLTVTNSLGCTNEFCRQVAPQMAPQCQLAGNFSYSVGNNGLTTFTDLSTDLTTGGTITSWLWKFDGTDSSTSQNPAYQFSRGFHNVCLTVTNSLGCVNTYCSQVLVNVNNSTCKLKADFSFTSIPTGLASFQDLSTDSSAGGATITSWEWDFGYANDSGFNNSSMQNPTHLFQDSALNLQDTVYWVCLTVGNSLGCTNQVCKQITIHKADTACRLHTDFSFSVDNTGNATFNDLTVDSTIGGSSQYSIIWSYGDNTNGYYYNSSHQYDSSGNYTVCLSETNWMGCTSSICKQVAVNITVSSLCVSLAPYDSIQGANYETEFYLIKDFKTANGDSLALVDTFIHNQSNYSINPCFTGLPNGTYYAKAAFTDNATQYTDYLPTYYTTELLWGNATPINLDGNQQVSINLQKGTNNGGPGFIGGYVSQGANRLEQGASTNSVGDPEPGETIILTTIGGAPVAHAVTDAQGHYQFSNLSFGTYNIYLDILNKPCLPLQVTIDDSTGYKENGNFQVGSKSVTSQIALGTATINVYPFAVSLMGNPVGDELKLYLQNAPNTAVVTITDLLGRAALNTTAAKTTQVLKLNTQNLAGGVYLITINCGSELRTLKFVKE